MNQSADFRFERKFALKGIDIRELEFLVRMHPNLFSEIFWPRSINNIYLDDMNMDKLDQNIAGTAIRSKVRIRWYGSLMGEILKPKLEFKIKRGTVGTKRSFNLAPFELKKGFGQQTLQDLFQNSDIPDEVQAQLFELRPVIINQYKRKYFLSSDKKYRITLDWDMKYYEVSPFFTSFSVFREDHQQLIMEIKYDQENEMLAHKITSWFPFRMTKNSKYINGLNSFHRSF